MQGRLGDAVRRHPRAVGVAVAGGAVVLLAVAVGLGFAVFRGALPTGEASPPPSASANPSASPTSEASPSSRPQEPTPSLIPYAAGRHVAAPAAALLWRQETHRLSLRMRPAGRRRLPGP